MTAKPNKDGKTIPAMEWKPIEAAPKDGSDFVALTSYGASCVMRFNGDGFVRSVTCRRCDGFGLGSLTHFLVLPEKPKAREVNKAKEGESNDSQAN